MVGVTAQEAFGQFDVLQGQCRQTLLHHGVALEQADQFGTGAVDIGE